MKIEIVTKNIENDTMAREFIQRKVQFALDRVHVPVEHAQVRLVDEAGNSDSFDGLCQIDVSLDPTGDIHVSAHGNTAFDSVLQATHKMENAIKHDTDRHRRSARLRHQRDRQNLYSTLEQ